MTTSRITLPVRLLPQLIELPMMIIIGYWGRYLYYSLLVHNLSYKSFCSDEGSDLRINFNGKRYLQDPGFPIYDVPYMVAGYHWISRKYVE